MNSAFNIHPVFTKQIAQNFEILFTQINEYLVTFSFFYKKDFNISYRLVIDAKVVKIQKMILE